MPILVPDEEPQEGPLTVGATTTEDRPTQQKSLVPDTSPVEEEASPAPKKRLVPQEEDEAAQPTIQAQPDNSSVGRLRSGIGAVLGVPLETIGERLPKASAILGAVGGTFAAELVKDPKGVLGLLAHARSGRPQELSKRVLGNVAIDVTKTKPFEAGEIIGREIDELFPQNPKFQDDFYTKVLQGAGSLASTIGVAAAAGPFAAFSTMGLSQASAEFDAAKAAGADDEVAFQTFLLNLPVGGLEAIPVAKAFKRFDQITGGGLKGVLARGAFKGSAEEAIQEGISGTFTNLVAGQTYDQTREIFDNVGEQMLIGGLLGGAVNATGITLQSRKFKKETGFSMDEAIELSQTMEYLDEQRGRVDRYEAAQGTAQLTALAQETTPEQQPERFTDPDVIEVAQTVADNLQTQLVENEGAAREEIREILDQFITAVEPLQEIDPAYVEIYKKLTEPTPTSRIPSRKMPDIRVASFGDDLTEYRLYERGGTKNLGWARFKESTDRVTLDHLFLEPETRKTARGSMFLKGLLDETLEGGKFVQSGWSASGHALDLARSLSRRGYKVYRNLDTYAWRESGSGGTGLAVPENSQNQNVYVVLSSPGQDLLAEPPDNFVPMTGQETVPEAPLEPVGTERRGARLSDEETGINTVDERYQAYSEFQEEMSLPFHGEGFDPVDFDFDGPPEPGTVLGSHSGGAIKAVWTEGDRVDIQSENGDTVASFPAEDTPVAEAVMEWLATGRRPRAQVLLERFTAQLERGNIQANPQLVRALRNESSFREVGTEFGDSPFRRLTGRGGPPQDGGGDGGGGRNGPPPALPPGDANPDSQGQPLPEYEGVKTVKKRIMTWLDPILGAAKSIRKRRQQAQSATANEIVQTNQKLRELINALRDQHIPVAERDILSRTIFKNRKIGTRRFFATQESALIPPEVFEAIDHILRGRAVRAEGHPQNTNQATRDPIVDGITLLPEDTSTRFGRSSEPRILITKELIGDDLWQAVEDLRMHIDRLSRSAVKDGLVEGKLKIAIEENLGAYIHRSYKKHTVPDWAEKVPDDIRARAFSFIRDAYAAEGNDLDAVQINNIINSLVQNDDTEFEIITGGSIDSIDTSPLKKRGEIAPEIRALMGEVSNPLANYVKTVGKLANIVNNGLFLKDIAEKYDGIYFFDGPEDPRAPFGFTKAISSPNNPALGQLAGKTTHPEIAEALQAHFETQNHSAAWTYMVRLNSIAKYSKTVLNQVTHARNILGGGFFMLANGNVPSAKHFKQGWKAFKAVGFESDEGFQDQMQFYADLGLDVEGARAGELRHIITVTQRGSDDWVDQNFNHLLSKPGSLYSKTQFLANGMAEIYRAEDVAIRIMMFEAERARLIEAYEGTGMTEDQITLEAAQITREVYQDYSQVPARIRNLSTFPIVGTFVSFQSEVFRTTVNAVKRGRMEIQSDNPKLRAIGWRRLMGVTGVLAVNGMMAAASMMLMGIDLEEDKELKRFTPPWDEDGPLIWLNQGGKSGKYINPSYYNPFSTLSDPITTLILGKDDEFIPRYIEAWKAIGSKFFGEEIMFQKARELQANKRSGGGPIYNPQDGIQQQAVDILAHVWDGIEPGMISSGERTVKALTGKPTKWGEVRDPGEEVPAFFGFRMNEINIPLSLGFRGSAFEREIRDVRAIYNRERKSSTSTFDSRDEARARANDAYFKVYGEMRKDVEAAWKQGMTWDEIEDRLTESGVSKGRFQELRRGFPKTLEFSDD